ncbi:MAG TPA: hypothetical protein VJS69_01155 [Candidatus Krumholzibacteria bacterium]|nr:hypothetical protein [Candidatus Krumholzibacteria bacterium]
MNYLLCRNRVRNFDQWKRVFDSHADIHGKAGLKLTNLWHEMDNPRHVFFLFEVEDMERARAFLDHSDASTSAHEAGLIEGDFHFFGPSLGYSPADQTKSLVATRIVERVASANDDDNASNAQAVEGSVPQGPVKSPELEKSPGSEKKNPEREKSPEAEKKSPELEKSPESEKKSPEPEKNPTRSESVKHTEPAKSSIPQAMKGPERVNSAPPDEPFEGWKPVENWPPAEEAATMMQSTPEPSRPRGRWERIKY